MILCEPRVFEEDLQEGPDIGSSLLRRPNGEGAVGEPDADWLVDVEDVCIVVLGVWIIDDGGAVINDAAGTVLLEKADHAGTSGLNGFIRGCR